ncbi:FMN-dependent NADH-azoreductase [Bosea psychrotolerans]|uniref:FMN dependent NADH:quinone oxidoreductase n=1 Tax=Bosea psychrotolerans TaxID=1871628 RepID=A0A2S4M7X8_9HYPH|nr:NAD(P)H-dependent oxidoreductase [Bosea psychrotolerans]POR50838.1 FMN-dependent NADH-azoreductase [Bosea psychrotolerans]
MTKLLFIKASPRGSASRSVAVAEAYLSALRTSRPDIEIDVIDLWQEDLPEFDGNSSNAKLTVIKGGILDDSQQTAWDQISRIAERFAAADQYLFAVPMWNGGIPYRLKLYIDIIHQPGILFGFDPTSGYFGLLKGKTATLAYTSGVYAPDVGPSFGSDFHSTYLKWWLGQVGITAIEELRFQPTLRNADAETAFALALANARQMADQVVVSQIPISTSSH